MKKLDLVLLFDIDGTLIKTGGAGKVAMEDAFKELFQIGESMEQISFAGSTDLGIFDEALKLNGVEKDATVLEPKFRKMYLEKLSHNLVHEPEGQEVLPGVIDFLNHCKENENIYLGLVTGNYREGARAKLMHFDLHDYFVDGAFGCDHADRNLLPALALKRIENAGYQLPSKESIWIIGDTKKDTLCAKHNQLQSWIVFTGFNTREEIMLSGPTRTSETLEDFKEFLQSF